MTWRPVVQLGLEAVWYDDFHPCKPFIAFFARRDIAAGEELTFLYCSDKEYEALLASRLAASLQVSEWELSQAAGIWIGARIPS